MTPRIISFLCFVLFACLQLAAAVHAEGLGVVAIVNDQAVTELDVTQRISLLKILGNLPEGGISRKAALRLIIDDAVKTSEAKRLQFNAN